MLLEDFKNGGGGVAGLKSCGEWVCKEVLFRALFILFQGIVDDELEVRGRGGSSVSMRHR